MKNFLCSIGLLLFSAGMSAQTKNHKFGITSGAYIQHYNGDLGNSFFRFKTTCFGGGVLSLGYYLNKSFDINLSGSVGDFGYCQTQADANRIVPLEERCPGCLNRLGMGELRSRMTSGNIGLKYKFADGYLLKEDSKIAPYVSLGAGLNHLADNMGRQCVNVGNYLSLNTGAGVKYNVNNRFNICYSVNFGYFIKQNVYAKGVDDGDDDIEMPSKKDLYLQNTLSIGINLF